MKNIIEGIFFQGYLCILLLAITLQKVNSQGIIIRDTKTYKNEIINAIDPARYEKILSYNFKIGQYYSDDRGFNSMLKYHGFKPGVNQFIDLGGELNYVLKKTNLGFKADFAFQTKSIEHALWHRDWQFIFGTAIIRKNGVVLTLNSHFGMQTSTIKFGDNPPSFLAKLNYPHSESKLFQSQFVLGPSISLIKIFDANNNGKGLSLGLEAGLNFAPAKSPAWKYGYADENDDFVGERIDDMPHAARQTYYTVLKIGFWEAH